MMEIILKRIYLRDNETVGCLQVGGRYFCDTIEPKAIPWKDDPFIGQKAGERIAGKTAIPEGRYRVIIRDSKTYKRKIPMLLDVPQFKSITIRSGHCVEQSRGDILIDRVSFKLLFSRVEEAIDRGEQVCITVRSPKEWTGVTMTAKLQKTERE